jgi:hypothetical protein
MFENMTNVEQRKLAEFGDRVMAVYYFISIQFESGSQ